MSRESMKDIIENSIRSAGTSETEVSIWVGDLKAFHAEETRRWEERQRNLSTLEAQIDDAAATLAGAYELLAKERQALARERAAFSKERAELQQVKGSLSWERERLTETINKLEPDTSVYFGVSFVAALFALFVFVGLQWLAPLIVRWVGQLLG